MKIFLNEKKKKTDNSANVEMTQMLALFEKDFIGAIIKVLQ